MILGLDTATADTCAAVCKSGGELVEGRIIGPDEAGRPSASGSLLVAVEEVVEAAGGWRAVELIGVGVGPGSFTGQRIGISTARALAQGHRLPLAGASTTEALARGAARAGAINAEGAGGRAVIGVVDARRGELFAERVSGNGRGDGPVLCAPDRLGVAVGLDRALTVGEGAVRFRQALEAQGLSVPRDSDPSHHLDAAEICKLAERSGGGDPRKVIPVYLRRPDADRWIRKTDGD